jgi:hypothetical protein
MQLFSTLQHWMNSEPHQNFHDSVNRVHTREKLITRFFGQFLQQAAVISSWFIWKGFITKIADPSFRPKKHVMFSCQNIQEYDYIFHFVKSTIGKWPHQIGLREIVFEISIIIPNNSLKSEEEWQSSRNAARASMWLIIILNMYSQRVVRLLYYRI